jgi:hypothetical protein
VWDVKTGACLRTLGIDRRYQRVDITGLTGITDAQRSALLALGAFDSSVKSAAAQHDDLLVDEDVLRQER